tara:strand:- start:1633 stop:1896 length:264 start_codon:yes stop_codon:yes gene_type:complete
MGNDENWKLRFISARDQNRELKKELLLCYKMLSTVAIDGHCESVEKEFLADLCEQFLPYTPADVLADINKDDFQWWKTDHDDLDRMM